MGAASVLGRLCMKREGPFLCMRRLKGQVTDSDPGFEGIGVRVVYPWKRVTVK